MAMAGLSVTHTLASLLLISLMWQRGTGVALEEAHPGLLLSYGIRESCEAGAGWNARFIDISHSYRPDMPKWDSADGLGSLTHLVESIAEGDLANVSEMKFENAHSGTHVDAPGHFIREDYEHGDFHVASLDLNVLIGKFESISQMYYARAIHAFFVQFCVFSQVGTNKERL